ncbi:MAG TPA: zinc-ribbon domain-containing protein, partial [Ktedonobacterales bacterium]
MQSTICVNCGQPLPAGAGFCGNCGAAQKPAGQPLPESAATIRAGAPPSGAEYAPTQLQPPPAPGAPLQGTPSGPDAYASQYTPAPAPPAPSYQYAGPSGSNTMYASGPQGQMMPPPVASGPQGQMMPPPMYAPGPPPVAAPGGGAQPWAQPPKKRSGAKVALGCLVALVLVVALLGGGGFLLVKALSSKGGNTAHQGSGTPGTGTTAGAGSTPGSGSTPGGGSGTQTLDNINRQAIYAGVNITIVSAQEGAKLPDRQESDPKLNALEVQIKAANQTGVGVYPQIQVFDAAGNNYPLVASLPNAVGAFWVGDGTTSGGVLFDVPSTSKIGGFRIQIGDPTKDLLVQVPLTGTYDPTQWQPVTHQIGQTIVYENGGIKYTVTQVVTTTWTPGCQAPKGTRFLEMYLHVTNNTALGVDAGEGTPPVYLLVFPNGDRFQHSPRACSFIDEVVGGG